VILDEWDDETVDTMESIGNCRSNEKYERNLTIPKIDHETPRYVVHQQSVSVRVRVRVRVADVAY
jgi:hypothetical protein